MHMAFLCYLTSTALFAETQLHCELCWKLSQSVIKTTLTLDEHYHAVSIELIMQRLGYVYLGTSESHGWGAIAPEGLCILGSFHDTM